MKKLQKIFVLSLIFLGTALFAGHALAMTPSLSLTNTTSDIVQVNVTGDANAAVYLYYYSSSFSGIQSRSLGSTNSSGFLSSSLSTSGIGIIPNSSVYVIVNSQQSVSQNWPTSGSSNSISFSPSTVTLGTGQSQTVTIFGGNGSYYISSSGNATVASVSLNGSTLSVYGYAIGNTSVLVCQTSNICGTLYINVNTNNGGNNSITFSQSSVSVNTGNSQAISIYGGSGSYYVSSNSNSYVATIGLIGSTLTVTGNNSGSTNVIVCQTSNICGTLYVTVNGGSNGSITFSQSNPAVTVGQTQYDTIYGGSGSYYISSNSNSSIVTPTISGNSITLYGLQAGYASISVCTSYGGGCGTLYVTVTGFNGSGTGIVTFSPSSLAMTVGQNQSVAIINPNNNYYYNSAYYVSNQPDPSVASVSVSGNSIFVYATGPGATNAIVCQNSGTCGTLYISVTGGYVTPVYVPPGQVLGASTVALSQVPYTGLADDWQIYAFALALTAFSAAVAWKVIRRKENLSSK